MPVPRYPHLERVLRDLRVSTDTRFRDRLIWVSDDLAEDLASGGAKHGFKWLCSNLEDLASEGFRVPGMLYQLIEEAGRAIGAPEAQWKTLAPYVVERF